MSFKANDNLKEEIYQQWQDGLMSTNELAGEMLHNGLWNKDQADRFIADNPEIHPEKLTDEEWGGVVKHLKKNTDLGNLTMLEYLITLPPYEAICLAEGLKYQTGSDYPQTTQLKTLEELAGCLDCYAVGKRMYSDDIYDICSICQGTGINPNANINQYA